MNQIIYFKNIEYHFSLIKIHQDRAFNAKDRLSSTATLAVEVTDADDQGPVFRYSNCPLNARGHCITPTYTANVSIIFI